MAENASHPLSLRISSEALRRLDARAHQAEEATAVSIPRATIAVAVLYRALGLLPNGAAPPAEVAKAPERTDRSPGVEPAAVVADFKSLRRVKTSAERTERAVEWLRVLMTRCGLDLDGARAALDGPSRQLALRRPELRAAVMRLSKEDAGGSVDGRGEG